MERNPRATIRGLFMHYLPNVSSYDEDQVKNNSIAFHRWQRATVYVFEYDHAGIMIYYCAEVKDHEFRVTVRIHDHGSEVISVVDGPDYNYEVFGNDIPEHHHLWPVSSRPVKHWAV